MPFCSSGLFFSKSKPSLTGNAAVKGDGKAKYRDYGMANIVLTIQEVVAWIMVVIGLFGIFNGSGNDLTGPFAIIVIALKLAALGSVFTGLLLVASVQTAGAHIHTAEMTWEMLELARKTEARATSAIMSDNISRGNSEQASAILAPPGEPAASGLDRPSSENTEYNIPNTTSSTPNESALFRAGKIIGNALPKPNGPNSP